MRLSDGEDIMINAILTIDDMPQENTIPIIDYLLGLGIKPLFFAIGEFVEQNPEPVIYALQKGLIVGNHTYSHANLAEVSYEEGIEEIKNNLPLTPEIQYIIDFVESSKRGIIR